MGLDLHCPVQRPYDLDFILPKPDWETKFGIHVIIAITGFIRYCVKIIEKLEEIKQCPEAELDRQDLLGVLQFHFELVCKIPDKYLNTTITQDGNAIDKVEDSKREFNEERKKFKGLLDKQLSEHWPDLKKISTWSLPQLFLRVLFHEKNIADCDWTFGMCQNLQKNEYTFY